MNQLQFLALTGDLLRAKNREYKEELLVLVQFLIGWKAGKKVFCQSLNVANTIMLCNSYLKTALEGLLQQHWNCWIDVARFSNLSLPWDEQILSGENPICYAVTIMSLPPKSLRS